MTNWSRNNGKKILPNISRQRQSENEIWSVKYNTKNIFLEKSFMKCGGENITRPFSKKSKWRISLNQ